MDIKYDVLIVTEWVFQPYFMETEKGTTNPCRGRSWVSKRSSL